MTKTRFLKLPKKNRELDLRCRKNELLRWVIVSCRWKSFETRTCTVEFLFFSTDTLKIWNEMEATKRRSDRLGEKRTTGAIESCPRASCRMHFPTLNNSMQSRLSVSLVHSSPVVKRAKSKSCTVRWSASRGRSGNQHQNLRQPSHHKTSGTIDLRKRRIVSTRRIEGRHKSNVNYGWCAEKCSEGFCGKGEMTHLVLWVQILLARHNKLNIDWKIKGNSQILAIRRSLFLFRITRIVIFVSGATFEKKKRDMDGDGARYSRADEDDKTSWTGKHLLKWKVCIQYKLFREELMENLQIFEWWITKWQKIDWILLAFLDRLWNHMTMESQPDEESSGKRINRFARRREKCAHSRKH